MIAILLAVVDTLARASRRWRVDERVDETIGGRPRFGQARCGCAFMFGQPIGRCRAHKLVRDHHLGAERVTDPWNPRLVRILWSRLPAANDNSAEGEG